MGETPDDIKYEVEQARTRLGRNLNQLEYHVRREFNWRVQFDRHPWPFMAAAFGAAMLAGFASASHRRNATVPPAVR
jgi:hypothetical protein